jgi:hypothetical protein
MGAVELLGLAASFSLLAGWRLYACVLAAGVAMRLGIIELPQHLTALDAFANPWVMGAAALGCIAELLADKVPWIDSLWDAIHGFVRPAAGALLALAILDPSDPATQIVTLLLGGGAALLSHGAKSGARLAVNISPEPFSNIVVSTLEDIASAAGLWLVLAHPAIAAGLAICLLGLALLLIYLTWRLWRRVRRAKPPAEISAE